MTTLGLQSVRTWSRTDIMMATFFVNLLGLMLPLTILQVYDRIIPNAAYPTFSILIITVCVAIVLEATLKILRARIFSAVGARYEHKATVLAYARLLEAGRPAYSQQSAGTYADKVRGIQTVRNFYAGQAANIAIDIPFAFLYLTLIATIAGMLVFVPVALLTALGIVTYLLSKDQSKALQRRVETDRRRHNFLVESLQGIHSIKAFGIERLMLRRYERLQAQSAMGVANLSIVQAANRDLAYTFSRLSMISYVALGSFFVIDGHMTLGGLAAGTMLTGRVLQPVLRGLGLWSRFQEVRIARERLSDVYRIPPESPDGSLCVNGLDGNIEIRNISFRYDKSERDLFHDISLKIPAGSMIGITGDNGCGLSTFLALLNGSLQPASGSILIDGKDSSKLDAARYRKHVGLIAEEGVLFSGTLLENLTLFRDGIYRGRAVEALRQVALEDFVISLPKGLETGLGGSVVNKLPIGVLQRITIARTLVNNPKILLFDNANSGLDMESDEKLRLALTEIRKGRTVIIATYRPSYLKLCDRVYRLADGALIEQSREEPLLSWPNPELVGSGGGRSDSRSAVA